MAVFLSVNQKYFYRGCFSVSGNQKHSFDTWKNYYRICIPLGEATLTRSFLMFSFTGVARFFYGS